MSAVKNLRAMFENKGDSSPADDDRGRSLGVSSPSPTPGGNALALSGSPRPLNKVRSSFVAIERNGVIGLVRDNGSVSRDSSARPSIDMDRESTSTNRDKPPMSVPVTNTSSAMDKQPLGVAKATLELQGAVSDKPSHNPDKVMDEETPTGMLSPADPTTINDEPKPESAPAAESEPEKPAPKEAAPSSSTDNVLRKPAKTTRPAATKAVAKPVATKAVPAKTLATKTAATKTAAAPKVATKVAPKPAATATTKVATDSSRRASVRPAQKTAETSAVKRESSAAARSTATARTRVGAATAAVKKPLPTKAADAGPPAAKPRTKSPTKPVGLPSSLTAPTASSVSKTGAASGTTQSRQTISRQSLSRQGVHPPAQSSSGVRTLKQQSSARARPSIGPPPAKPTREAPKKVKEVDEGFLARMMRPTQASSSKFQEPTTPPKKSGSRPSTAGTVTSGGSDNSHYEASPSKKSSPKKVAASKPAEGITKKSPSPTLTEEKFVAKPTEEVDEEPIKDVTHEDKAPVRPAELEPHPVEEAAAETANVETVEEVVAIAEEAELTQAAPEPVPEVVEAKAEETPAAEPITEPEASTSAAEEIPAAEPTTEPEASTAAAEEAEAAVEKVPVETFPIEAVPVEEAPIEETLVEPVTETVEESKVEVAEPIIPATSEKVDEAATQASS
ncbi:hypothetical protein V8C37DRAFT_371584 [Trichoderma ceciliae]